MNRIPAGSPLHVNYYLAPTSEVERRIPNIRAYYFMNGLRAEVRTQAIDNDDGTTLLITSLFNVEVDDEVIQSRFTPV